MPSRKRVSVLPALSSEVADADLGDSRLTKRLGGLVDALANRPGESFPKALDDAELEGAYRFFGNDKVTPEAILAPHFRQTARRAPAISRCSSSTTRRSSSLAASPSAKDSAD